MIDKEKNNARYRLSHCVNVLFSVDHGTFRWRRGQIEGIVYQNTRANGYRFTVWANGKQIHDWQISSFNLVHHLHKSNPFSQKTATKAWGRWMSRFLPPHFFVGTLWSFCRSLWKRIPTSCLLRVLIHRGGVGIKMERPLELVSKVTSMKWNTNFSLEHLEQKNVTFSFQKFCCSQKFF